MFAIVNDNDNYLLFLFRLLFTIMILVMGMNCYNVTAVIIHIRSDRYVLT